MFLRNVLDIAHLDLQYIDELLEVIEEDESDYTLREELADLTLREIDANTVINAIFYRINQAVYCHIKKELENHTIAVSSEAEKAALISLCEERINEFSPCLNCLDSHFNNELDQVTISGNTLGQIVTEVIPLLLESARS